MTEEEARRLEYEEMRKSRPDLTYEEFKKEMGLDAELGWDGNLAGPDNPPREYKLDPNQGTGGGGRKAGRRFQSGRTEYGKAGERLSAASGQFLAGHRQTGTEDGGNSSRNGRHNIK